MSTLENLTEHDLIARFSRSALNNALRYRSRMSDLIRAGNRLTADVMGTERYTVEVTATEHGLVGYCTCPIGENCKHIAAVLLHWLENPAAFQVQADRESPTAGLEVIAISWPPTNQPVDLPAWMKMPFAAGQKQMDETLRGLFDQHTLSILRPLASQRGWRLSGTRKSDIVEQVTSQSRSLGETAKAIYSLDQEHQQVLRACALFSGRYGAQIDSVEATAKLEGPLRKYQSTRAYQDELIEAGLLFPTDFATRVFPLQSHSGSAFVPPALARYFPPLLETAIPSSWELDDPPSGAHLAVADPSVIVRHVQTLLFLFEQTPPVLRPPQPRPRLERQRKEFAGWMYDPAEAAQVLARPSSHGGGRGPALTVPPPDYSFSDATTAQLGQISADPAYLDFLYAVMRAADLLQMGSPAQPWAKTKDPFLMQQSAAQHALLARSYFGFPRWTELWEVLRRTPDLRLKRNPNPYLNLEQVMDALAGSRDLCLRFLAYLPDNRWVRTEHVRPYLRALWPKFPLNTPGGFYGQAGAWWFLTWQGKMLDEQSESDWTHAQWAFFQAVLSGPLHWLGLVDLLRKDDEILAFRLRGLADLFLEREEMLAHYPTPGLTTSDSAPAAAEAFTVEGSSRIRVDLEFIDAKGHQFLRRIAKVASSMVGYYVYQLDEDLIYRSFQAGSNVETLLADWENALPAPMPQPVQERLRGWWDAYGQVRIYRGAALIEFGDDYALAEMKAVTELEKALVAELSPRLALVESSAVADLVAQLEKAGYTPKIA